MNLVTCSRIPNMRSSFSRVGDHNQRYINDDKTICRDNIIELTPSGEHDDSLKYTNIPDNSSNNYTLTTNRTSAEKKTDGRQHGPKKCIFGCGLFPVCFGGYYTDYSRFFQS
jgi:hypothetical protein